MWHTMREAWTIRQTVLVQIAGSVEMHHIDMDTLFIEQDSIPDGGRSSILDPKNAEVELTLANAMHQLDA